MEATVSVSKGVFLFKNGFKKGKQKGRGGNIFRKMIKEEPWYTSFKTNWNKIESEIKELNNTTYSVLLNDMVDYIKLYNGSKETETMEGVIPSATLLTGVNQPDHLAQFVALTNKIRQEVTPHIAMVHSQDAPAVKHLIENVVWQFINGNDKGCYDYEEEDLNNSIAPSKKLRKNQCTMTQLKTWYEEKYETKKILSPRKKRQDHSVRSQLVVIIPDFESFNSNVLQDFVMIMSSYVSVLPLVLVFGVATSVSALHKSFPYHVSSKLMIKVFHSHSSPVYMNKVLEEVFLNHSSLFHLSGKAFELLTDVFLFYDFSVTGLIQSIKYCMMDHYYGDNTKSLCCDRDSIEENVSRLTADDLEQMRQLPSFRPFLEAQDCTTKISLFEDDNYFRESLCEQMNKLHDYLFSFYTCLRLFSSLVNDLPRHVLGKSLRELYSRCLSENIASTGDFKESMQLLSFQSQDMLVQSIKDGLKVVNAALQHNSPVKPLRMTPTKNNVLKQNSLILKDQLGESFIKNVRVHLLMFLRNVQNANTEATVMAADAHEQDTTENVPGNRYRLKEKLLKATQVDKVQSEFDMIRSRFISYLEEVLSRGLLAPSSQPYHETLFFSAAAAVRKHIVGAPRGALHTALSNPHHYLQCACCRPTGSGLSVSADVCACHGLLRECGRLVNLYDWLQAFAALHHQGPDDEDTQIDPILQARFTRAVAELQFLGFIKSSKRKTDHVMRLTW